MTGARAWGISQDGARHVYTILVGTVGARRDSREDQFVFHWCDHCDKMKEGGRTQTFEFRFEGNLGFGGKFFDDGWKWWVSCYREDDTEERKAAIAKCDIALADARDWIT